MENAPAPNYSFNFRRFFWQTLFINLSATVVVTALNYVSFGWKSAFAGKNLVSVLIYSNCIGTLCGIVITGGAPYFSENSAFVRFAKITAALFVATLTGIFIGSFLMTVFGFESWENFSLPSLSESVFSLIIAFSFGFSAYFYEVSQTRLRRKEIDEANARRLASEAQLASLASRIHPHFLFNTLNSIAALIREDPILAEKMVEKLSALLRYSLDSNAESLVSLKQELDITQKYLEIEKVRFDKRLNYEIETDEAFSNVRLPPLSLQTLVENSIKHVASKSSGVTEIKVSAKQNGTQIFIEVRDNGAGFSSEKMQENHGLDILQKRLTAIFQNEAHLEIQGNGAVTLKLPKAS